MRKALIVILLYVLAEVSVLVYVGRTLGVLNTFLLLFAGAFFGVWIVKRQGLSIFKRIRADLDQRKIPGDSLMDGACLLIGGFLFVVPGFISDLAGLLFLVPSLRFSIKRRIVRWLQEWIRRGGFWFVSLRRK
ncbi:FxsA family protein [Sporolactobacillus putidus]|uniref:UPF0716 protein YtzA n=1 Tax=Sporolactobacillus putidus TaxID=492735 RepID=A0A917RWC1_9BACL|nr:FxsA family protein [Sporolactobacillus putidus]GGL42098.1 UPF0716 protein YtzA [Sporolactobacillus putidus]